MEHGNCALTFNKKSVSYHYEWILFSGDLRGVRFGCFLL
jgi:hypothetical protein